MKQRILFVDDEPKVLDGIGRMLRGERREWDMEFAPGGRDALEKLALTPFDVIVTDMRMPQMDGAQLLTEVRERYPRTVRIVLTGQCDKEAFVRLAGVAHRYLNKPCDPTILKDTVKRACQLRAVLANEKLLAVVSRLESVPSRSASYQEVVKELECDNPSLSKVAAIIARDMGMTAKVWQLANSPQFGGQYHIANTEQAVALLGCDVLKALVVSLQQMSMFDAAAPKPQWIEAIWKHSLATSVLARRIAMEERCDSVVVESACVAGMLHDTGKIVCARYLLDTWNDTWELARRRQVSFVDAEQETLGSTHAEIGAYLLGLWGLPAPIVEAVAWHHRPAECPATTFTPLTAVHVADVLTGEDADYNGAVPAAMVDEAYLARLGLRDRLAVWRDLQQQTCLH